MEKEELYTRITFPIILFFVLLFGGAFIYTKIEHWTYLDALYFSVATATTVGYGDIYPITSIGKIFTMIFAFLTIGIAFYFFTLIGRYLFAQKIKKEILESKKIKQEIGIRPIKV